MDKLKRYSVTIDSDVFAISLVEFPAIEEDFIYLSKDEKPQRIILEQDEKHLVIGPVLIPDKPIYRNNGTEEFFIQFSKETIEQLAYNFLKNGFQSSITEQHEKEANGITVVESWLKTSENDKSNDYGMNLPVGTWMCAMKIENEDIWEKIKSGEMNGFSIEAFVNLDEIKLQKDNNMKTELEQVEVNESFWNKLKEIISSALKTPEVNPEEADEAAVEIVEDVKDEVKDPEEKPEEEVEMEVEQPTEEVNMESMVNDLKNQINSLNTMIAELKSENEKNAEALKEKDVKIEELNKDIEKMSKEPSTEPLKVDASKEKTYPTFLDYASGRIKL